MHDSREMDRETDRYSFGGGGGETIIFDVNVRAMRDLKFFGDVTQNEIDSI